MYRYLLAGLLALVAAPVDAGRALSRDDWRAAIEGIVPDAVCETGERFRTCYRVSSQECVATAGAAIRACLGGLVLPVDVDMDDNARFGDLLGACATRAYHTVRLGRFIDSAACRISAEP